MMQRASLFVRRRTTAVVYRSFHKSAVVGAKEQASNASGDTRLAGRRRFYKHVGTLSTSPPWETSADKKETVDSPISAGVDGTQSASGVGGSLPDNDRLDLLQPRNPVTGESMKDCRWFGVTLDGRSLKTPLGQELCVPSPLLAWAIAAEWDAQQSILQPAQMPLMTLCCTAMDQVATSPDIYKETVLRYLPTDTTCYWADPLEDRVLHRKQQDAWESLHDYCESYLESRPSLAMGASEGVIMSRTRSSKTQSGLPHPPELLTKAREWVDTLDAWHLCALHSVIAESKSFLVGMGVLLRSDEQNPFVDLAKAVMASRVEEEFQIDNWGLVEGGHDYDRLNCSIQIHSAHFLTSSISTANY